MKLTMWAVAILVLAGCAQSTADQSPTAADLNRRAEERCVQPPGPDSDRLFALCVEAFNSAFWETRAFNIKACGKPQCSAADLVAAGWGAGYRGEPGDGEIDALERRLTQMENRLEYEVEKSRQCGSGYYAC